MIKKIIDQYVNEVVIGRVGKVERTDSRVNVSMVENYDQKGADPKWVNLAAFDNEHVLMAERCEKACKPGATVVFFVKAKENGQYINRVINDFKVVAWPPKKAE